MADVAFSDRAEHFLSSLGSPFKAAGQSKGLKHFFAAFFASIKKLFLGAGDAKKLREHLLQFGEEPERIASQTVPVQTGNRVLRYGRFRAYRYILYMEENQIEIINIDLLSQVTRSES